MKLLGSAPIAEPKRILFIHFRRIGDVVLGSPALRAVAVKYPHAVIDFVAESPADEALWGHPLIDRLLVAPHEQNPRSFVKFACEIRKKKYDWVIDFFSNPRSAQFAFITGARTRVGLDRRGRRWAYTHRIVEEECDRDLYAVDLRLNALALMGVPSASRSLEVYSDSADPKEVVRVEKILQSVSSSAQRVAVAAGSANPAKRYPADLTAKIITLLQEKGFEVILTAGPGEGQYADEIIAQLKTPISTIFGARIPTLAALYRRVQLYVGPDSAPKHVAAACGLPTVTIFGPGRPFNWTDPQNPQHVLHIAPCDVRPYCIEAECARRQCLRKILPEDVVESAIRLLKNK